jgi:hypothetical protein
MTTDSLSDRIAVIAYAPADRSLALLENFEEADGCLQVVGVLEGVWKTLYRLDGERLTPVLGQHDWVEQLVPTGVHDLPGLLQLLTQYAREHRFSADGSDPGAFVAELARRGYESRWPKWPRWLDRRMHGDGPSD